MKRYTTYSAIACISIASCGQIDDKPTYPLGSSQLHSYSAGDQLVYRIVGDRLGGGESQQFFGEATSEWENATNLPAKDPNGVTLPAVLRETSNANVSIQTALTQQRYVSQSADNSYSVIAWAGVGDRVLWASADGKATFGVKVLAGTLGQPGKTTASYKLYDCNGTVCSEAGDVSESLELVGKEEVTTNYAIFEAYRYSYFRSVLSRDTTLVKPGPPTVYETRWIFPRLGTVKYAYLDGDGTQFSASLARTSIRISDVP